jgi:hypothetical protein
MNRAEPSVVSCGAAELLRRGGPVRVPLRECCAAALIGVTAVTAGCRALNGTAVLPPARAGRDGPVDPVPGRVGVRQ